MSKERKVRGSEAVEEEGVEQAAFESDASRPDNEPAVEEETSPADAERLVASLEQDVADLKDQLLRKQADFENFRKRIVREREDAIRYANASLLLDLVETIDNFERAIKSSGDSRDFDTLYTGVDMIEKQLTSMLENKYGLKRFESTGEEFDPELHEAVTAEESPEVTIQTVLEDLQKGYKLHDRVLRHAKVRVAIPPSDSQTAEKQSTGRED